MKNIFLLLLAGVLSFSCSDDDSADKAQKVALATKITTSNGNGTPIIYDFIYDNDRRIQSFTKTDGNLKTDVSYEYDENHLVTAFTLKRSVSQVRYVFKYNDKILQSITVDDEVVHVSYDPANRMYTFLGNNYTFADNGDLAKVNAVSVLFAADRKGVFNAVGGSNFQLVNQFTDYVLSQNLFQTIGSKSAVVNTSRLVNNQTEITSETTADYDAAGYPTHIEITQPNGNLTIKADVVYTAQ